MRPAVLLVGVLGCGSGASSQGTAAGSNDCDGVRPKVEQLYRADAQAREPARVAEAVADNTAMVLADCKRDPARITACVPQVSSAADLERRCLIPLDEEGTEGDRLAR